MTKTEFLQQLYNHLLPLTPKERDEIIQDFEEHFSAGFENGKTEEQICSELGNPYTCALQYLRQPIGGAAPLNNTRPEAENSSTAYKPGAPYRPTSQVNQFERRNRFLWGMLFVFFILCAFGVYPASVALMFCPLFIALGAIFAVAAVPTAMMVGLMICLAVFLFAAGLFSFMVMTWLLRLCYRHTGL